ncbi:amino acid ABC transporter substrate-binding protein [Pseudomonas sp. v388]|uniref:amino acid ABC transporter substrate-binding protein n=1 Tax=Pseudomonas sp. v388 TaxID=2479849 RepID=UPI000F76FDD6|nr:amino acid ABC transporter substrate-binding protein [Pseudomonas sp. v388]RRV04586.1 amino acid ABC transporter substrate-binding protein [Pseudomonas sp. v388]
MNRSLAKITRLLSTCVLLALPLMTGAATLERVRGTHTLTLGYLPDQAPFSSAEGDQASGYAIDLCLMVADRVKRELGMPDLEVRYRPVKVAEEVGAVSVGEVDILCTPTPPTLERRRSISYSIPVYTAGLSVVVRNDAPQPLLNVLNGHQAYDGPTWRATINRGLANHTYATVEGGVTEDWIRQRMRLLGVVASLVTVANADEGVQLVADGKADAFFSERMLLRHEIATEGTGKSLMLLDRIFDFSPVAMIVERGDEDFRLLVDTALSEAYYTGAIEGAYNKHFGATTEIARELFKVYALP